MPYAVDMSASGRIYQNPANRRELWFNLGWYIKDKYKFPSYEGWMGEFVSADDYSQVVKGLQDELNGSAVTETKDKVDQDAVGCCLMTLCLACPVCTCRVLLYDCGLNELKGKLTSKLKNSGIKQDMRIEFVKVHDGKKGESWRDHESTPLQIKKKGEPPCEGGPPPGCNLVITTQKPIQWPPQREALADALQMGVAGAKSAIQGAVAWAQSDEVQDAIKGAVDKTKDAAKAAVEWAQSDEVQDAVKGAVDKTKDAAKAAVEWAKSDEVQDAVKDAAKKSKEAAKDAAKWVQTQVKPIQQAMAGPTFEPSESFKGTKPGWVYKDGDQGRGYYKEDDGCPNLGCCGGARENSINLEVDLSSDKSVAVAQMS